MDNDNKKLDEEVESIIQALDQLGETLAVMHEMIGRLKSSVLDVDSRSTSASGGRRKSDTQRDERLDALMAETPIIVH
ncbi:hypothetical protein NBRC116494_09030 [Aurantivibrio plasticivorans]